ncbi:MAG: hypothetical protein K6E53_00580 [Lachnospiraceae bacterium]|nr:hypothetical protein [Lachnospiraceae bacterium]
MNKVQVWDKGIKLGLTRMRELMHLLGDPQDKLKFIHVAGTNGKGSTCSFISAALQANGFKVGMYISPAVENVREQYTINGEWISENEYALYMAEIYAAMVGKAAERAYEEPAFNLAQITDTAGKHSGNVPTDDLPNDNIQADDMSASDNSLGVSLLDDAPTAFEMETALAFLYFYRNNCDYVVLETGLGGRGDATNIVNTTVVSVLTSISEDHLGMIGNDLEEIAYTKAGIIKKGVPVVMTRNPECVEAVVKRECDRLGCELYVVSGASDDVDNCTDTDTYNDTYKANSIRKDGALVSETKILNTIKLRAKGIYQKDNALLALEVLRVLKKYENINIDKSRSTEAINGVIIPCRMEKICDAPLFYLDGAHNPEAAKRLRETVERELAGYRIILIMGMFRDKDYRAVISEMAPLASCIFTVETPDTERALPKEELCACIKEITGEKEVHACEIAEAVKSSINMAATYETEGNEPCIIAFGSLSYLKLIKGILTSEIK